MNNKNVFISYGHNELTPLVKKMVDDIRDNGFNVFFDADYLYVGDWEKIIDDHIKNSMYFIFTISNKSTSLSGYCLNELCRAGEVGSVIVPIQLDDSLTPLSINKFQRISMIDCLKPDNMINEPLYLGAMSKLIPILNGQVKVGYSNDDIRLKNTFKPISSREDLFRYYLTFCGRDKVFNDFEKFMYSDSNFMWISAGPGTGKTAFSSMLCWKYPSLIGAIHFCKFNNSDRVNPRFIISSIAYHLANCISEYRTKLLELIEIDNIFDKNASRIFEYLIIEPLYDIHLSSPLAVVIDALDECSWRGGNELATILYRYRQSLPSWLKFVITSRNEREIRSVFINMNATICNELESSNSTDLRKYYLNQFPSISEKKLAILLSKSENSFLYASEICKQIKNQNLSLDDINFFPVGIYGFFNDCFTRIFGDESENPLSFEKVKPLLEIVCIAQEPLTIDLIPALLPWDEYEIKDVMSRISSLFPVKNKFIEPLHKSLIDWLTNEDEISQIFFISKKNGYKRLYTYVKKEYDCKKFYDNVLVMKYFGLTLIQLGKYDELLNLLNDYEFQNQKIKYLRFDSGLELYLQEMKKLSEYNKDLMIQIFNREAFRKIFSKNRRLLYNSGMFFTLKEIGFSIALNNIKDDWGLDGEIGKIMYYYIVEDFHKVIKNTDKLFSTHSDVNDNYELFAEIYNTKGLSLRKLVKFEEAIESLEKSIECGEKALDCGCYQENDPEFEISLAHLIKGKIYLHMLDFPKANRNFKSAIKVLEKRIDELPCGDKKTSNILFLAEDYRVYADACVWQKDYEKASEFLRICDEIYRSNNNSTDRYFLRYQYTVCFHKIMSGDFIGVKDDLQELLKNVGSSKYDKAQINFYLSLLIYKEKKYDDYKEGLEYASKASDIYFGIDSYMEEAESNLMIGLFSKLLSKRYTEEDIDNNYIEEWVKYILKVIDVNDDHDN